MLEDEDDDDFRVETRDVSLKKKRQRLSLSQRFKRTSPKPPPRPKEEEEEEREKKCDKLNEQTSCLPGQVKDGGGCADLPTRRTNTTTSSTATTPVMGTEAKDLLETEEDLPTFSLFSDFDGFEEEEEKEKETHKGEKKGMMREEPVVCFEDGPSEQERSNQVVDLEEENLEDLKIPRHDVIEEEEEEEKEKEEAGPVISDDEDSLLVQPFDEAADWGCFSQEEVVVEPPMPEPPVQERAETEGVVDLDDEIQPFQPKLCRDSPRDLLILDEEEDEEHHENEWRNATVREEEEGDVSFQYERKKPERETLAERGGLHVSPFGTSAKEFSALSPSFPTLSPTRLSPPSKRVMGIRSSPLEVDDGFDLDAQVLGGSRGSVGDMEWLSRLPHFKPISVLVRQYDNDSEPVYVQYKKQFTYNTTSASASASASVSVSAGIASRAGKVVGVHAKKTKKSVKSAEKIRSRIESRKRRGGGKEREHLPSHLPSAPSGSGGGSGGGGGFVSASWVLASSENEKREKKKTTAGAKRGREKAKGRGRGRGWRGRSRGFYKSKR